MFLRARWLCALLLIGLAVVPPSQAQSTQAEPPADARRYTILVGGNNGGALAIWSDADGAQRAFFEYQDRGRGPRLTTRRVLNENGVPISVDISGHNYRKIPVVERFSRNGTRATWQSEAELGEATVSTPAFYVTLAGSPDELEVFAKALLASADKRLSLLPSGTAGIKEVGERVIEANGRKLAVTLYEISGTEFAPTSLWLTRERELFAGPAGWFAVAIQQGWEESWPILVEAQLARAAARGAEVARTHARKPTGLVAFKGATVFDSAQAGARPNTTVVVSGDRIRAVGPDGKVAIPPNATVIDARGKSLLPGLWDMHVHLTGDDGVLHIAAGVTSVRDLGNTIEEIEPLRRSYDEGTTIGPRVIPAGFIDGRGPFQGPTTVFADTPEEARAQVARYRALGYPQIKVYNMVKPEIVRVLAEEAHRHGMRLSGHVPAAMSAAEFIHAGADEIQHADLVLYSLIGSSVADPSSRARSVAEQGAAIDLSSPRAKELVDLLREHRTVLDPTLSVHETLTTARTGKITPTFAAIADRVPSQVRRRMLRGGMVVTPEMDGTFRKSHVKLLEMVAKLHRAGIRIVAGSDDLAGFTLHRELELYVEAGIPPAEALQIATLGAARVMKRDGELGSIETGKKADVFLVAGDPIARIQDIRNVELTMKGGVLYDSAGLYQTVSVQPHSARR